MISDEAVEAAAKAIHASWDDQPEDWREHTRQYLRAALEAAVPYMLAPVWLEGYREGELDGAFQRNGHEPPDERNPYRGPCGIV